MIPAVKMLDPVMGVDIHIILIPTPGGPVPTPIPHPFVGMVLDPMDLVPIVGATVMVNGMPRAQAGTGCKAIPPHIPMGGPFQKPPANEGEMFMGSATVEVDGDAFTYMGLPVLTCNDIGMPPPPRAKKKGGTKSMVLPTSVVMAIPAGPPVLVGGPPTISLMALGMKVAMAGLGKAFKKLKKTKAFKKLAKKAKKAKAKAASKMKNAVARAKCFVTGHPVDIVTGKVFTDAIDFELPGPIPLKWERVWYSTSDYEGALGHGWHHNYDHKLMINEKDEYVSIYLADGRLMFCPLLEIGEEYFDRQERITLRRNDRGYYFRDSERLNHYFTQSILNDATKLQLSSIENDSGFALKFSYNQLGHLTQITDSAHRVLKVDTDIRGRITTIHAPHPEKENQTFPIIRYKYDEYGNLTEVLDALNQPFKYQYDFHLLVKETNRNGLSFYFEYEGQGTGSRCVHTWGDGGIYDHKLKYSEGITFVENSLGYTTTNYHNGALVTREIDPMGNETTYEYNQFHDKITEIDPLGRTTKYDFDNYGNQVLIEYPDGSDLNFQYENNLLVGVVDQIGSTWKWTYNEEGNLVMRENPLGLQTLLFYDQGLLTKIIDTDNAITTLEYDSSYNLKVFSLPNGATISWKYDNLGNNRVSIDPKKNVQRRIYDLLGRIVRIDDPDSNRQHYEYDPEGNILRMRNNHQDISFTYKGLNCLATREEAKSKVEFIYNTEEQLIGIKNEHGSVYSFELNPNGEIELESGFDQIKKHLKRDAAGQVISVLRASGIESNYSYDANGRLIRVKYSDGGWETYSYRPDGALIEATNEHTKVVFERDVLKQVTKEQQGDYKIFSEYNEFGLRSGLLSSLGAEISFRRNVMGDVVYIDYNKSHKWEAHIQRDIHGLEISCRFNSGIVNKSRRDQLGRPTHQLINNNKGKTLRNRKYDWEANDRLKQLVDGNFGATMYRHDIFGNLSSAQYSDGSSEFRMPDEVGNLFRTHDRSDRRYGRAGQLLEAEGTKYYYDQEGNLIRKEELNEGTWTYDWNSAGMLKKVTRPDGKFVTFKYDALGRRISKSFDGYTTKWVWDGNNPLHEWQEIDSSLSKPKINISSKNKISIVSRKIHDSSTLGSIHTEEDALLVSNANQEDIRNLITWIFEPESFTPLAKIQDNNQYSICNDHLSTPIEMYDQNGKAVWSAETSIYGQLRNLKGEKNACPFRFPGQYEDVETGLYYNRYRYYDADSGEYISQDPIGLRGGRALYAYVADPNIWADPLGLLCQKLRKRLRQIEGLAANPGNSGVRGALSRRELMKVGREFVGPNHTITRGRSGEVWMVSADGRRLFRSPTKKTSDFARTGTQANFHQRSNVNADWFDQGSVSNVHVHMN